MGEAVVRAIQQQFFRHLEGAPLSFVRELMPHDRRLLARCADIPVSASRLIVSLDFPPAEFRKIAVEDASINGIKAFENPRLFGFVMASMAERVRQVDCQYGSLVVVSLESMSIPLAAALARELTAPQIYLRKPNKTRTEVLSKRLGKDGVDLPLSCDLQGKEVVLVDDGKTAAALLRLGCELLEERGAAIKCVLVMARLPQDDKEAGLEKFADRLTILFDLAEPAPLLQLESPRPH
jgi:adenine/guanine phosphoribosyltransferase-like PRPP-binding protein